MNWYLESGKNSDIVESSRIRIARNIKGIPFVNKMRKEDFEKVLDIMENAIDNLGYGLKYIRLKDIDDLTKLSLVEKHVITPELAFNKGEFGAFAINEEENISIMINEDDHIRIQVFSAGEDLKAMLDLAIEIDEKLGKQINYAYNEKFGFLSNCPTNVGTGLKASVMVHLPALARTENIRKILDVVNRFDMNIRGIYGDIYQISNKQTLGISEEETIRKISVITEKVMEQEKLARNILLKNSIELEDRVYRLYGILANCRKLTYEECSKILSEVKLGVDLGIIKELTDSKLKKIELYAKPANLQKYLGETLEAYDRDIKRTEVIKRIIQEEV